MNNGEIACIDNITKSFGDKLALNNVSFKLYTKEIFGYVGPNGAGKTTTIRLMTGLLHPSNGKISIFGEDPYISSAVRAKIGIILDTPGLWENLTIYQNMRYYAAFFRNDIEKEIHGSLKTVDLDIDPNQKVNTLSKGMRQRLAIARVLVHDPDFLIFDEPTANLDPNGQREIQELLQKLANLGKTIFLSSHNLPEVQRLCQRVGIINNGRLLRILDSSILRNQNLEQIYFETMRGERV